MEEKNTTTETTSTETKTEEKKNKSIGRELFEWAYSIVIAIIIAFLIKGFLFDIVKVDGSSMKPTLLDGDRLIVTKLGYEPKQGDIIILDSNYSERKSYFEAVAANEGKDELSGIRKFTEGMHLPKSLKKIYYVKRVIATEGQTVDIRDGKVYVDGEELDEPYYSGQTFPTDAQVQYPFTVSEDCVFVMGDNRGNSTDSRSSRLGEVDEDAVLGKAQLRIFPFNSIGKTR
ncbi:MAG: signal peptidase I [Clostridiales bacterium]|nr:signal peptidase I [Clostridiales bacterium]